MSAARILLDTNVLSELMRPRPEPRVLGWFSAQAAQTLFEQEFRGLNLAFDEHAAPGYAAIVAARSRSGAPISVEDAQIAAIASHHRVPLATRNTKDFVHVPGLVLINPWEHATT